MKPFLSACLIVKNEEDMLQRCLESLQDGVDEIIVVDTGSTDNTKKIAKEFTDKVYDFEWTNDFAEARNFAGSKASGEWIFAVDADECVEKGNIEVAIKEMKSNGEEYNTYSVEIISFLGEEGQNTTAHKMNRIYKNDGTIRFNGAIHEQLVAVSGTQKFRLSSLTLYHYGYLAHVIEKQDKKNRNLKIIKQDLKLGENKGFSYFNYGQELRRLKKTKEALDTFVKAYQHKESIDEEWVRICLFFIIESLMELKRYEDALKIVEDAEIMWPSAPDFIFSKGDIYLLQKRFDDAKQVYQAILANQVTYSDVVYHFDCKSFLPQERLGGICEIEKNDEEALKHYIKVLNENESSLPIISSIARILSKYHTAKEVYGFLLNQNIVKTDTMRLNVIKYLLSEGYADLAVELTNDLEAGNKKLIKVINLKGSMIASSSNEDETLIFEKHDVLLGIQEGIFDLADLCVLYHITKDEFIAEKIKSSKFKHIFTCLFEELKRSKKMKQEEYLAILRRALRYKQVDFVESLIALKKSVHKDIDAKIADLFYENGYEDIAIDFYERLDRNQITKQGYVNMIEWFISQHVFEEAYLLATEAIDKFKKDFRFYKYAIETTQSNRGTIVTKALREFPDSNWLKLK
ncbi:glycosyltransferase [Bacillus sp. JJ864]|uniref:tetratricopeptide repeat-containing glycosyltransferase family 2 protein n=1 Tax=Bacillus sp. JJ864 TaxID=3122975 RepID=UPI002FFF8F3F